MLFASCNAASAQTEVAKLAIAKIERALAQVSNACSADLRTYCGRVTPGDGRVAFCLAAHEDKVSQRCFEAMLDVAGDFDLAANRVLRTASVCRADIASFCASVPEGQGRVAQCLVKNKTKLRPDCRGDVAALEARLKH